MKEKDLQAKIRDYLRGLGWIVIKLTMLGRYGSSGWPDLLVLLPNSKLFFLEVKTPKGRLTATQQHRQKQLRQFGFSVYVVRSLEEVIKLLEFKEWTK